MRHPRERLFLSKRYNRRDLLRLSGALTGGVLLSACGGAASNPQGSSSEATGAADEGVLAIGTPDSPAEQPLFDDLQPIASGLDPEPGPLRIYNWADYSTRPPSTSSRARPASSMS